MAKIPQGSTEYLRVDVTDRTGELTTIVSTNPTYDVRAANGDYLYDNEPAVAIDEEGPNGETLFIVKCMIDTDVTGPTSDLWVGGEYRLYIDFTTTPEMPRLGPYPFTVDDS